MNTGIQDGYNLAWKMWTVLRGNGSEKVLETYNTERLANAENLLKTTDRFFNLAASPNLLLSFLRIYVFPSIAGLAFGIDAVKTFVFPRISQIGINYRRSSLSDAQGNFSVNAGDRMPYFLVDGKSIYDRLRQPKFHLLVFSEGENDFQDLRNETETDSIDFNAMPLSPEVKKIFGTENPLSFCSDPIITSACFRRRFRLRK